MLCLLQPGTWAKFLPEEHGDGVQPEARALVRNAVERVAPSAWIPTHLCNRDDHTVHVGAHRGFLLHWLAMDGQAAGRRQDSPSCSLSL